MVGGPTSYSGRLSIYHNGEWGSICDHGFFDKEANIACKELGHTGGRARRGAIYGQGDGRIWLDALDCSNADFNGTRLMKCHHGGWGNHDCTHKDDVSIDCGTCVGM